MGIFTSAFYGIWVNAIALYLIIRYVEGVSYTGGFLFFIIGGLLLAVINAVAKPIIKIFSAPLIFLSGGLFLILINAAILSFLEYFLNTADFRNVMMDFSGFSSYLIAAIILGLFNWFTSLFD